MSAAETIFNTKLLIFTLPSFSLPKIHGSPTRVTMLKVATNMADPISINYSVSSLNRIARRHGKIYEFVYMTGFLYYKTQF